MGAQPNKFQFILNIRGVITEVLANAPDGWLNTAIKYTRSNVYQGLFRGETLATKYVTRAASLLRNEFYTAGVLGFVKVAINLLNPATWGYNTIYNGRLDFSTAEDDLASFTVNSISDDFTVNLNANDGVDYMIPVDTDLSGNPVAAAVNIELPPLTVRESATFVPGAPPDGVIHSDYFPPMDLAFNQQNSVNYSSKAVQYGQLRGPDWATSQQNFFCSRVDGKLKITGSIQVKLDADFASHTLKLYIINDSGTIRLSIVSVTGIIVPGSFTFNFNQVLPVATNEKLFLYMQQVDAESANTGITITGGSIQLDYDTVSPATMCKALPASYVFGQLLQAMNTNTDSGPNQPVPFKSDLLTGPMSQLMITCSDSIRNALGSIVNAGQTVFPGIYEVIQGTVNYGTSTFTLGEKFPYQPGVLTFTGTGVLQKIVSGFVGAVYNPGDPLQAGGTFVVGGDPGTFVTYNAINYNPGQTFKFVLGQDTFTGSDDTSFVEQVGIATQLIINFKDFFQSIYGVQGGNCSFGIETIANPDPVARITQPTVGRCFIENLAYVYRGTIGNLDAGKVDTDIKIQPAADLIPNSIIVGYNDQQYSTLNGYSEVNSTQTYITSIVNPKKQLNLVSVIRADPYGIEEIRVSQNDTAASRSSNDNFFIYKLADSQTVGDVTYYLPLTTEQLTSIVGVDPSYYNWIISPKQNLLRGAPYLASIFYNMGGYSLTLSAAPKNTAMVTTNTAGKIVSEAAPVLIASLGKPLFLPFYASFKPGIEQGGLQMIDSIPYGFIKFTYNGTQYKMFAQEITVDIGQNSQQQFKGLLTPGNDLTTLIH